MFLESKPSARRQSTVSPATRAGKYRSRPSRSGHSLHHRYLRFYLCWKRTRRLRLVIDFRIRTTAWPGLSGRATLAAARSRSRWVLVEGCPVLSVHFAFGLAPHIGQRTDNMCRNVRFSGFTPILFNIANLTDGQSCSWNFNWPPKRESPWSRSKLRRCPGRRGCDLRRAAAVLHPLRGFQSAPRPPSLAGVSARKCHEAAC